MPPSTARDADETTATARRLSKPRAALPAESAPAPAASDSKTLGVLAQKVRAIRTAAGLTLQQLATRSGVSQSALSKIENGQLSPTYERIVALANGLGVEPAELFTSASASVPVGRRGVTRAGQGVKHSTLQYDYEALCSDVSGKSFLPLHTVIKARDVRQFASLPRHEGEEFVFVVKGKLTLHTEFYEPLVLLPGDSVYYDSGMGHALVSSGDDDAEVLWVCSKNTKLD